MLVGQSILTDPGDHEVTIALITSITTLVVLLLTQAFQWNRDRKGKGVAADTLSKVTQTANGAPAIKQGVDETSRQVIQLHERVASLATHTESLWIVAQQWRQFMERWEDLPAHLADADAIVAYFDELTARLAQLEERVARIEGDRQPPAPT